jgi:hypothetical protein
LYCPSSCPLYFLLSSPPLICLEMTRGRGRGRGQPLNRWHQQAGPHCGAYWFEAGRGSGDPTAESQRATQQAEVGQSTVVSNPVRREGRAERFKCNHCGECLSGVNSSRLKTHLLNRNACPPKNSKKKGLLTFGLYTASPCMNIPAYVCKHKFGSWFEYN